MIRAAYNGRLATAIATLALTGCGHASAASFALSGLTPAAPHAAVTTAQPTLEAASVALLPQPTSTRPTVAVAAGTVSSNSVVPTQPVVPALTGLPPSALERQLSRLRAALLTRPNESYQLQAYSRSNATVGATIAAEWTSTACTLHVSSTNLLDGAGQELTWDLAGSVKVGEGLLGATVPLTDPRLKDVSPLLPLAALSTLLVSLAEPGWRVVGAAQTSVQGENALELQFAGAGSTTRTVGFYLNRPFVAYLEERDPNGLALQLVYSRFDPQ